MSLLHSLRISASALMAQRLRMDVVANNVANMNTSRTAEGGPYKRQSVSLAAQSQEVPFRDFLNRESSRTSGVGVRVSEIREDNTPPRRVFDPAHPDADPDGYVLLPDINTVTELTDLVSARRAYEASVTVLNATKSMALQALQIGRG